MVFDSDEGVRRKGVNLIRKYRLEVNNTGVRQRVQKFERKKKPPVPGVKKKATKKKEITLGINLQADRWDELVTVNKSIFIDPPCLKKYDNDELLKFIQGETDSMTIPEFPIHSQSVERAVRLTTEVSTQSHNIDVRNSLVFGKIRARKIQPTFESKKRWNF